MFVNKLHKQYRENQEVVILGIGAIVIIYLLKTGVAQFAFLFPSGLYRYAATGFMVGMLLACSLMFYRPLAALFILLLVLPLGARLAEFFKIELSDLVFTVDVIAIWMIASISILIHGLRRDGLLIYFALFLMILTSLSLVKNSINSVNVLLNGVLTPFLIYILTQNVVKKYNDFKAIVIVLALVSFSCSLFAFVQPIINDNVADLVYLRLVSVFYNPIIFANVLLLLWPFILIVGSDDKNQFVKLTVALKSMALIVSLAALFFAGSRGADLICGLQILWIINKNYSDQKKSLRKYRLQGFVVGGIIITLIAFNLEFLTETIFRRFFQSNSYDEGGSASERFLGAMGALELGFSNILVGVGLGEFKDAYKTTYAASIGQLPLESAHNFVLNLFAEVGIFGLAIWLLIIFYVNRSLGVMKSWFGSMDKLFTYRALQISFIGYTASQFLFYGEFLHKNVGLPMVLYFVVFALISSLNFIRREGHARV
jgi:O-antigen ligase